MEPVTAIAAALALGAAAGVRSVSERFIKDAYDALRSLLFRRYGEACIPQLEQQPSSNARRMLVEEELQKLSADRDADVLEKARAILDAARDAPETTAAVGVALDNLKAASARITQVLATSDGVIIKNAHIEGALEISNIRAGVSTAIAQPENPKN